MKNRICHFGYFAIPVSMLLFSCTQSDEPRKPNIIYILADDLGRAELGCYGQEIIETPNIDRLASEGMRFTNHYSGQDLPDVHCLPVCTPVMPTYAAMTK